MGVYKNKNKIWSIRCTYKSASNEYKKYNLFGGKKGFALKKGAEKADAEYRERVEMSNVGDMPKSLITLKQGFDLYVKEKKTQLKESTLETNKDSIKVFNNLLNCKITSITPVMIKSQLKKMDNERLIHQLYRQVLLCIK